MDKMPLPNVSRMTIAHMGMGRWNRQPIKSGSSEHDDRVGGGVSLTAVSDFDDDRQAPSTSPSKPTIDSEKVNTNTVKSYNFNNGAKLSGSSMQVDHQSLESPGCPATSSSVNSTDASMSPPDNLISAEKARAATMALMDIYNRGKRNRSATTPAGDHQVVMDLPSDRPGNEMSTAHSSPIKHMARRNTGISEVQQQNSNGSAPSEHGSHVSSHAPSTPNSGAHPFHFQTSKGQHLDKIQYNPNASAFTPTYDSLQSAQMSYPKASPHRHHRYNQSDGFATGSFSLTNAMQGMSIQPGSGFQGKQSYGFLEDQAHGHQTQMQGHINGNNGHVGNNIEGYPPVSHANSFHMPQGQVRERSMSYNDEMPYDERAYHGQWQHRMNNEGPAMAINGAPYHRPNAQNTPPGGAHGYNYGLPGSASAGSLSQYYPGSLSNASTAMVQYEDEPVKQSISVGPLQFEMPTKQILANRSEMLQTLTENGQPSLEDVLNTKFLPFIENYKYSFPSEENGVIVIKNIPYETTRGEIIALLGKTSKILNDRQEPVHIIMDRVTSKTQDAFCELTSLDAAIEIVQRFTQSAENGRLPRVGNRVVDVELSSQTVLMKTLFPSSRNGVLWKGTRPHLITDSQYSWENFKYFFTEEEMIMLSKHIEHAQRTVYARICPERPYECMISTLRKIPWYMADYITIKQRHAVYNCCMNMIRTLIEKIDSFKSNENVRRDNNTRNNQDRMVEMQRLTPQLLDRLVTSAMLCPGFSVVQKHNIAFVANLPEQKSREFNQPRFPDSWRHQWTLIPKANMPIDVLEWYIAVIRTETERVVKSLGIHQKKPLQDMMVDEKIDGYWGFFWTEVNSPVGPAWDNMSLADCGRLEWQAIERILTRAVEGGTIPPSYTYKSNHISSALAKGPAGLPYRGC